MQREIETTIAVGIGRFTQEYLGRKPKQIDTYLLGNLLVVRLQGVLAEAEQQLVQTLAERGRALLKRVRGELIENTRPVLEAIVQEATGIKVVSLHHDISTATGEEVVVFTLEKAPAVARKARTRRDKAESRLAGGTRNDNA